MSNFLLSTYSFCTSDYDKRNTYLFMKEVSKRKRQSVTIEVVELTKDNRKTFPSGTGFSPVRK